MGNPEVVNRIGGVRYDDSGKNSGEGMESVITGGFSFENSTVTSVRRFLWFLQRLFPSSLLVHSVSLLHVRPQPQSLRSSHLVCHSLKTCSLENQNVKCRRRRWRQKTRTHHQNEQIVPKIAIFYKLRITVIIDNHR